MRAASIVFEAGKILSVEDFSAAPRDAELIDAGDLYVLPGLIDTHVHVNDPGRTEWEGFCTATRAAAAGGCTSIVDMPLNSIPATTSARALEEKRVAAKGQCLVDYAFWGGVVPGNEDQLIPLARAGVRGYKCFLVDSGVAEFPMITEADLARAMPLVAETGLPLLAHAELPGPLVHAQQAVQQNDPRQYETWLRSRPADAEVQAIRLLINLCGRYRCRVHIVHLSAADALPSVQIAQAEGLPITVETCPHYLYFSPEDIGEGQTQFKCAPPIREAANRERLWDALRRGLIDLVATDHSPSTPDLKRFESGDFFEAWGGIASLSLAFQVLWTAARRRGFEIADLVRWMSEKPAELAGFETRKGRIAPGFDADFAVFDADAEYSVTPDRLHFRHAMSPYVGERLRGEVKMTFVRGTRVFADGEFAKSKPGVECRA
ncbi:MAG: allantoinase AllB [Acidobacteriaceae bacterium]|nr:allantoinase AllB [Acidobacteriaceae bacterium]